MGFKNPDDSSEDLLEAAREIKRAAFHLFRLSQDTRLRFFYNGFEADAHPIASVLDTIRRLSMESARESRKLIRGIEDSE